MWEKIVLHVRSNICFGKSFTLFMVYIQFLLQSYAILLVRFDQGCSVNLSGTYSWQPEGNRVLRPPERNVWFILLRDSEHAPLVPPREYDDPRWRIPFSYDSFFTSKTQSRLKYSCCWIFKQLNLRINANSSSVTNKLLRHMGIAWG